MTWVNKYVKEYYDWLKEKTFIQEDSNNDWAVINTPFIGAFNDGIDIYAKIFGDKVRLSDNGETFNNLELLGVNIQGSKNRRSILDSILLISVFIPLINSAKDSRVTAFFFIN